MRKKLLTSTLMGVLIILAMILAVATAGCGTITQASAQTQPAPATAQDILNQALASSGDITSGTGDFNVSVTIDADKTKLPAGGEALLGQPITMSGTLAFSDDPQAAEATINASIAGQTIPLGLKVIDDKVWIQFMGQWYEAPADMMGTGATGTTAKELDMAGMLQAMTAAGVDPTTWMVDLKVVGEDSIDGTPTYHLSGTIDMSKIMTDVVKLMQDKTIQGMLPSMGSGMMGTTGSSLTMPSQEELQGLESQLGAMFKNVTLDMWVTKDAYQLRQVELNASIVPPAGQDAQGINGIGIKATVSMAPATTALTVTPPADAKPLSELEKSLGALQGLFSGALGGVTTQ